MVKEETQYSYPSLDVIWDFTFEQQKSYFKPECKGFFLFCPFLKRKLALSVSFLQWDTRRGLYFLTGTLLQSTAEMADTVRNVTCSLWKVFQQVFIGCCHQNAAVILCQTCMTDCSEEQGNCSHLFILSPVPRCFKALAGLRSRSLP